MSQDTLTLTDEQVEQARQMREAIEGGAISHPTDVVDEWGTYSGNAIPMDREWDRCRRYVPVEDIQGPTDGRTDRMEPNRLDNALWLMLGGHYEREPNRPPHLVKREGDYYIGADGIHRSLVFKALGFSEMFAQVEYIVE
jgi:hypothetical protein